MNRSISIGLSIAVAPALLLAYGNVVGDEATVRIASMALFSFGLPLGAVLILVGMLASGAKRARATLPASPAVERAKEAVAAKAAAIPARVWRVMAVVALVTLVLWQIGPRGGLHAPVFRGVGATFRNPLLWITAEVTVAMLAMIWILATRRVWGAIPFIVYWLFTVAALLITMADQGHGGVASGLFAFVSAMFLAQPWTVPLLQVASATNVSITYAQWIGIALNQVLLGMFALLFRKRAYLRETPRAPG